MLKYLVSFLVLVSLVACNKPVAPSVPAVSVSGDVTATVTPEVVGDDDSPVVP